MSINLAFGNPNREFLSILKEENYLDSLLTELKNYPPPSFDDSAQEISTIIPLVDSLNTDTEVESRYKYYDSRGGTEKYIQEILVNAGTPKDEVESLIAEIKKDANPLLLKLKYNYQRIRPIQLSFYYNQPLYPYDSVTALTPSYPSGHTFLAYLYCEVLGNRYPKFYQSLMKLAEDIAASRIYLGVHYISDNEFAKYCADVVINHPDFKKKYKL